MVDRILSMRVADLFKDAACVENLMENGDFFLGKSHAKIIKIKYKLKIMLTEKKKKGSTQFKKIVSHSQACTRKLEYQFMQLGKFKFDFM